MFFEVFPAACRGRRRCPPFPAAAVVGADALIGLPRRSGKPPSIKRREDCRRQSGGEYLSSSPSQPLTNSPLFVEGAFGRSSAPPLQALRDTLIKSTGLPHQCAHWFAMTHLLGTSGRPMVAPTKHIGIGIERRKTPPSRAVFVDFIPDRWLRRCAYAPSACGTGR